MVQRSVEIGTLITPTAMGTNMARCTSVTEFAAKRGYFPSTIEGHERHDDGTTLITTDNDSDMNIEIYDDDRTPHRTGEHPDWAKDQGE